MSERDPDLDAISEADIFIEARDRLQISIDGNVHNRTNAKDDLLFREGLNHWDNDFVTTESAATPELVINFTDTLVTRVVNSIADLDTRGKCHPIADGADTEVADVITGIGRHIEYRSDAQVAYDIATDSAVTVGEGWARLLAEYASPKSFDKELRIVPIMNIFSVYPDPGAIMPDASDMNWCLISLKMQRTEYKRLYPKAPLLAWNDVGRDEPRADWEDREEIRLAEYFRLIEKNAMLYRLAGAGGEYTCYANELPSPQQLALIGVKIVDERESVRKECQWFRLNGSKVVSRMVLPWSTIPIVRCQGNARDIDGRIYRRGMVRTLQDPQRMVDYGEVAKVKRLGLTTMSKYIAAEGQLDGHPEWTDSNLTPIPTLTYKPITVMTGQGEVPLPPPQAIPPAQVEAGFSEFVEGMRSNLLAIAGMPNEPGQDERGQTVSGKAIQRRDKLSDQSHSQYYKNKKLFVARIWKLIVEGIPHYYSEERMQRIIGGDGKPQMVKLNEQQMGADGVATVKNDLCVGEYDVVMDAGASYETRREEGAENLMELMGSPPIAEMVVKTAPDLLFRSMDFDYAEEIADRLAAQTPEGLQKIMEALPKEARAVVQSLSAQNAQLKQALQQAQLENKFGIAKAHLAAAVKAHDVEESNKTKRADVQSRERTTLAVHHMDNEAKLRDTEIKVSGELLNTHVEAKYHEREAERLIAQGEKEEKPG